MRFTRRPAWPVVFLLAAGAGPAEDLRSLERLHEEIRSWNRIQRPDNDTADAALRAARADAAAEWTRLWPNVEIAWRERLRALLDAPEGCREAEEALAGAARARGAQPGLRFPEDTRFLMARAAVRCGIRTEEALEWLGAAEESVRAELPDGDGSLVAAYRQERLDEAQWRAASLRALHAYRQGDGAGLRAELDRLAAAADVLVLDPSDRIAVAERARRRCALFAWRARQARLRGDEASAGRFYEQALAARPVQPGASEFPENAPLLREAAELGARAAAGTPIPPALSAGPHWLPSLKTLEGFTPDGRPAIAAVWSGRDPAITRALERLRRQQAVRILSFQAAKPRWIARVNPLYAAAQLWVIDRAGTVRLVGRLRPGGDGWEHAVTGAALRLAGRR